MVPQSALLFAALSTVREAQKLLTVLVCAFNYFGRPIPVTPIGRLGCLIPKRPRPFRPLGPLHCYLFDSFIGHKNFQNGC